MPDSIKDRIVRIIAEQLGISVDQVTPASQIVGDLYADSLDEVELVMSFEDEFGIEITDEEAQQVKTVQQVIDLIERLTNKP